MSEKIDLRSMLPEELPALLKEHGIEAYRAKQIVSWLEKGARSFEEMTNLSKAHREKLSDLFEISNMKEADRLVSKIDGTRKYLFTLPDGEYVESVLLSYKHGYSVCLSTQVGCKMGCRFCASTKAGFCRNLSAGEILLQMVEITRDMRKEDESFRIGHVVLMGIGEPLDNYDNVLRFLKLCNHPNLFGIGYRNISLSTCGLIPQIRRLMQEDIPLTLSISLHASNAELRSELMPVNRTYPMEELLRTCKEYTKHTGRRISFEYAVIAGVNDTPARAKELIGLLGGWMNHLNLIPVNPTKETSFRPSDKKSMEAFVKTLEKGSLSVTVRRTLGTDIEAACGQLRREKQILTKE
ncbi:MAG: 23S rRNA (adenine(2503)-C(2))-methyltransferase RlmN [Ruminococcaceae bacterium]|nr:23S rRNA (adenine(2503)-C(2))-methyltransferase RlmN [Oscillospiraceae bacterium]